MGLLMSETMLLDPILEDGMRVQDTLLACAYAMEFVHDDAEYDVAAPTSWPLQLIAAQYEMASI